MKQSTIWLHLLLTCICLYPLGGKKKKQKTRKSRNIYLKAQTHANTKQNKQQNHAHKSLALYRLRKVMRWPRTRLAGEAAWNDQPWWRQQCSHGSTVHDFSLLKKAIGCLQCIHVQSFCITVFMKCKCAFTLLFFSRLWGQWYHCDYSKVNQPDNRCKLATVAFLVP